MQKIGNLTPTADANGEWTNGNVAAGTPPTIMDAGWFNTIQRELVNIVTAGGLVLDPQNDAQVIAALKKVFLQAGNNFSEIFTSGSSAQLAARINIGLGTSSTKDTGTGNGQIPDMSSFASVKSTSGRQLLPSGLIRQWTQGTISTGGTISFPTAFPTALLAFSVIHGPGATGVVSCAVSTANRSGLQLLHNGTTNLFTVIAEGY